MGDQTTALGRRVYRTITVHRMFQTGDWVLIGVSGGPDSVALLHLLLEVGPGFDLTLAIAHLNHDLRGEASDGDADFVAALAMRLGLPFYGAKRSVLRYRDRYRLSVETAARQVRYAFFDEIMTAHGFDKIALGHHMDDNAEMILMNLFRGSGPRGLGGIPPVRDKVVRPLIDLTRRQIMAYLRREEHDYVIDTSNTDRCHLRNRIRFELLPQLVDQYNRNLIRSLNRTAVVFRSEDRWIERILDPLFESILIARSGHRIVFSVAKLTDLDPAVKRRLIRRAIKYLAGNLRRISFTHVEQVLDLATIEKSGKSIDLPHRIRVHRTDRVLIFSKEEGSLRHIPPPNPARTKPVFCYVFTPPGDLKLAESNLRLVFTVLASGDFPRKFPTADSAVYLDLDKLDLPLVFRNWKAGDRFSPLGLGGTQSVGKFLAGREKDPRQRALATVMVSGGRIVWVIGHGIAEGVKITPGTRRVLKAEVLLA